MDEKLEKYRSKVRRKEFFNKIKQRLINMVTIAPETHRKKDETIEIPNEKLEDVEEEEELIGSELDDVTSFASSGDENENDSLRRTEPADSEGSKLKYISYFVWFCFWATCWMIAIELQFGIVYLLFSGLFGIYFNTRTSPKRQGEVSAYSVFNENCESIKGTLTAEQLQREMMYGPLSALH